MSLHTCKCNFVRLGAGSHLTLFCLHSSHLETSVVYNVSTLRFNQCDLFSNSHNGVGRWWLHLVDVLDEFPAARATFEATPLPLKIGCRATVAKWVAATGEEKRSALAVADGL